MSIESLSGTMSTHMKKNHRENCTAELSLDYHYVIMFHSCHNIGSQKIRDDRYHLVLPFVDKDTAEENCPRSFVLCARSWSRI